MLDTVERTGAAHGGRTVPAGVAQYCHTFQDPALMRESRAVMLAHAYLAHRLLGVCLAPTDQTAMTQRLAGVSVYTHGVGCCTGTPMAGRVCPGVTAPWSSPPRRKA